MSIAVLGAGAFGTALAVSLARKTEVVLWVRDPMLADQMQTARENQRRLPGVSLPDNLRVTADLTQAAGAATLLLAVPMQQLRGLMARLPDLAPGTSLVACCKGIELQTGLGPCEVISRTQAAGIPAILTGPSFADDIARGLPTALTLACGDAEQGRALQQSLSTQNLRLYRSLDVKGAEVGGALKNVMAIACGAVMGAGLGDSARAALMTRGYAEMVRYAQAIGGQEATLSGLSGFGDLALTCTSTLSRNFRLGHAIGAQQDFDPSITVEGAATAQAVAAHALELGIDMPISNTVKDLTNQTLTVHEAMRSLLSRPLREE